MNNSWMKTALFKESQTTLQEGQDTRDGSKIYFISGNTYPIRTRLGRSGLGFRWYKAKGFWWMPASRMTPQIIQSLSDLGVNTAAVSGGAPVPGAEQPVPQSAAPIPETSLVDKSIGNPDAKAKFPVKNNIYSENITVNVNGQPVDLMLELNRVAKTGGDRYRRTYPLPWRRFPRYNISVKLGDELIGKLALPINRGAAGEKDYFSINEDAEIVPQVRQLSEKILNNPDSKAYKMLEYKLNVNQRTPEFSQFLEKIRDWEDKDIELKFNIQLPGYDGEFPIVFEAMSGDTLHVKTELEHPLAPYPAILHSIMFPSTIKTVEEFMTWLNQTVQSPEFLTEVQPDYIKYLKSFAFSEEEQQEERGQLDEILPLIRNRSMDLEFYRRKMIELGYVRPSKRQKQQGPGMVPQGGIKFILDKKKILADGYYPSSRSSNSAKFYYALIAYWMHRLKAGNISFMPMAIMDNLRYFSQTLERHGIDIPYGDLNDYTESLASQLLQEITGQRPPGTAWDNWEQFYTGGGETGDGSRVAPPIEHTDFVQLAISLGANPEQASTNPKSVYRELSMQYHPDLNPNADPEIMAKLNAAYNSLPQSVRASSDNWFTKAANIL